MIKRSLREGSRRLVSELRRVPPPPRPPKAQVKETDGAEVDEQVGEERGERRTRWTVRGARSRMLAVLRECPSSIERWRGDERERATATLELVLSFFGDGLRGRAGSHVASVSAGVRVKPTRRWRGRTDAFLLFCSPSRLQLYVFVRLLPDARYARTVRSCRHTLFRRTRSLSPADIQNSPSSFHFFCRRRFCMIPSESCCSA